MSSLLLFPAPDPVLAAIAGSNQLYPVNRIFCVGRNYHAHAAEMGVSVDKTTQEPFYFTKHPRSLVASGSTVAYPPQTSNYHYEMELVVAIGKAGFEIHAADANDYIYGYACGLDMTRRDLQLKARESNRPWDLGKDFEESAILSPIVSQARCGVISTGNLQLSVNGNIRQKTDLDKLIWSIPEVIEHLSRFYHLQPGDLIYTGTPEGVGAVVAGDKLEGEIEGVGGISLSIG